MALHWWWDFGIGMDAAAYNATAGWTVNGASVVTNASSNLMSPGGSSSPGDKFNLQCNVGGYLDIPIPGIQTGWICFRTNRVATAISDFSRVWAVFEGSTNVLSSHFSGNANPEGYDLRINGVNQGDSSTAYSAGEIVNVAVKFDFSANPNTAELWINGVQEVTGSNAAAAKTLDRIRLASTDTAHIQVYNTIRIYDAVPGDDAIAKSTDVWSHFLEADAVSGDTEWSIYGGASTKVESISDEDDTTGLEASTDPSAITIDCEDTTDVQAGWSPTTIYAVQAVVYATADTLLEHTIDLEDGSTVASNTETLTGSVPQFVHVSSEVDSGSGAWDAAGINAAHMSYSVAS